MKDTRLLKLIRTFTKEELKSFEKFLQSPFLRPARDTTGLYNYIIKFYPDYDNSKLEKERVFEKIFKGESYNEKKLLNLIFDLTKAAEDFLALSTLMEDETEFLLNLSKGYSNKNLTDESNRVNKLIEKKLKPGFSTSKDYVSKFRRLSYLKSNYFTGINDFGNLIETKKSYFEASAVQFIIDYTHIIGTVIPAQDTYGKNIKGEFIETIMKSFDLDMIMKAMEKSDLKTKHLILLHYYLLKINLEKNNPEYYFLLRDVFYELLPDFDREEKCMIFNDLVNFCVQNYERDTGSFKKEIFDVYKKMLENKAYSLSENEYMQVMIYRNIVLSSITLRELKWLEHFIKSYTDCLQPEYREDLRNISYANLYYIQKEYEKALSWASKINNEFFLFKFDLKNMLLIIYYELDYFESAFSMVDSYKHYLSNSKEITPFYKVPLNNFLKLYFDLLKIKSRQGKETASFVKNKIKKESQLISKNWLLEKADQLISSKL